MTARDDYGSKEKGNQVGIDDYMVKPISSRFSWWQYLFSFEFKTPLAITQNYASALENDALDDETRREYLETQRTASGNLAEMVTNILRLNKIENQTIPLYAEPYDVCAQLCDCVAGFSDKLDEKNWSWMPRRFAACLTSSIRGTVLAPRRATALARRWCAGCWSCSTGALLPKAKWDAARPSPSRCPEITKKQESDRRSGSCTVFGEGSASELRFRLQRAVKVAGRCAAVDEEGGAGDESALSLISSSATFAISSAVPGRPAGHLANIFL